MKQITSLDLYYLCKEFQVLIGAKVEKIYENDKDKKELLFQLHVPNKGKHLLYVQVPEIIFFSQHRPSFPQMPPGFCVFLRKYLNNARIREVRQVEFERILEIILETKEQKFRLILEFITPGNVILCNEDYMIRSPLETQNWKDRTIRGRIRYEFPKFQTNTLALKEDEFKDIITKSKKENIVKTLAIDFGLGGQYAEYLCKKAEVNKNKKTATQEETKKLFKELQKLKKNKIRPNADEKNFYPLEIINDTKSFSAYSGAIDSIIGKEWTEKEFREEVKKKETKLSKTSRIIREQEQKIKGFEKSAEENQKKGEIIYENYETVKDILDEINKARKKYSWKEIKEKLKGHKIIKDIDEKQGKITVELK